MLRVLASYHRRAGRTNPYVDLLERSLAQSAEVVEFSWSRILFGRYDIFHVHWPEQIFRSRCAPLTVLKLGLLVVALWCLRVRKTVIVRTVHNSIPHESPSFLESKALELLDAHTDAWILLNSRTPQPTNGRCVVVPHGDYRQWFAPYVSSSNTPVAGRILMFGKIRGYKGVEKILQLAAEAPPGISFRIVGDPDTDATAQILREADRSLAPLTATLRHVSDAELADEILSAEAVVLPYRHIENSGAALLALSLGRPLIATASETMVDLQQEVGNEWVQLIEDFDLVDFEEALTNLRVSQRAPLPVFRDRDWDISGARHLQVYTAALKEKH